MCASLWKSLLKIVSPYFLQYILRKNLSFKEMLLILFRVNHFFSLNIIIVFSFVNPTIYNFGVFLITNIDLNGFKHKHTKN